MADQRDPVEVAANGSLDLYDIATWTPRSRLDALAILVYNGLVRVTRGIIILVAFIIITAQFVLSGLAAVVNPTIGLFILFSILPALAIAVYVWKADVTMREPLRVLVMTFVLGVLFAGFAAILNTIAQPAFMYIPVIGVPLFFFVIVGPVEETVKWLAVRLHAYRSSDFRAVIDGAVYGAMAGLGFATIENTLFIGQQYLNTLQTTTFGAPEAFEAALGTALVRTFAGPGHVIYSAFAGYYLGLAKFNQENAGPIVVKGLLIAAFIHAGYNSLVGVVPATISTLVPSISVAVAFLGFVIVYDGIFGYILYRKIARYRNAYRHTDAGRKPEPSITESVMGQEVTDSESEQAIEEDEFNYLRE